MPEVGQTHSKSNCKICALPWSNEAEEGIIQCDICLKFYHGSCLDFDDQTTDLLQVVKSSSGWACNPCIQAAGKKIKAQALSSMGTPEQLDQSQNKILDLEKDLVALRSRLASLEATLTDLVRIIQSGVSSSSQDSIQVNQNPTATPDLASGSGPWSTVVKKLAKTKSDQISSIITAVHGDLIEKKNREKNIIISGLKPSNSTSDVDLFRELCEGHFDISPVPTYSRRLGKDH